MNFNDGCDITTISIDHNSIILSYKDKDGNKQFKYIEIPDHGKHMSKGKYNNINNK